MAAAAVVASVAVAIIGGGPAAYTAALYLARANLSPLVLTGPTPGGLVTSAKEIENFPGCGTVLGTELTAAMEQQAVQFGAEMRADTVDRLDMSLRYATNATSSAASASAPPPPPPPPAADDADPTMATPPGPFRLWLKSGQAVHAKGLIIATGASPRHMDHVPGYARLWNKGISACATCDGSLPIFRGRPIVVVGGGDTAAGEALHLTHTASHVYLIHRRDSLRASKVMADRVLSSSKIDVLWDSEVTAVLGGESVEGVSVRNVHTGATIDLPVAGVFVAIGHLPNTAWLEGQLALDPVGFILTGRDMSTSIPGVWAAGDVQDPLYRQVVTAAASGAIAALESERYLLRTGQLADEDGQGGGAGVDVRVPVEGGRVPVPVQAQAKAERAGEAGAGQAAAAWADVDPAGMQQGYW